MNRLLERLIGAVLIAAAVIGTAHVAGIAETAYFERSFEP